MVGVEIRISGDYKALKRVLRKIRTSSKTSSRKAAKQTAGVFYKVLTTNIRTGSGGVAALSPSTLAKRRLGKLRGTWPVVPRYSGTKPLLRSGALLKAIQVRSHGKNSHVVEIRPGAKSPEGKDLRMIAAAQEGGVARTTIHMTQRMAAYLHVLREGRHSGKKGSGSSGRYDGGRIIKTFYGRIPARPVWGNSFQQALEPGIKVFINGYLRGVGLGGIKVR